jgi:hypothetical protein
MILDSKERPLLGHVQAGLGLIGYLSQEGASFAPELAKSMEQVESYCAKKKIPITDLGFTGELDFLVKELGVVRSRWSDPRSGTSYVLCWYNLGQSKSLPKAALAKLEELTVIQNPGAGANPEVFKGKTSRQIIDAIALDCRSKTDAFSHLEAKALLEAMSAHGNFSEETQQFVTTTQVEMLELDEEEDRAFRRYCYSFSWKAKIVLTNEEMDVVAEVARRTSEEQGSLTITTYSFESVHGGFSIISHRTRLVQEDCDETVFYGPYAIRDGDYPGLPTKRVLEVLD